MDAGRIEQLLVRWQNHDKSKRDDRTEEHGCQTDPHVSEEPRGPEPAQTTDNGEGRLHHRCPVITRGKLSECDLVATREPRRMLDRIDVDRRAREHTGPYSRNYEGPHDRQPPFGWLPPARRQESLPALRTWHRPSQHSPGYELVRCPSK